MVKYQPGEVISECYPFAHCIDSPFVDKGCHYCLKDSSALRKCSKCKVARYCNTTCQAEDWKNVHKNECEVFLRGSPESREDLLENCSIRLALRIVLLLQDHPKKAIEEVSTFDGKRSFNSLMSHSEEISKQTHKTLMLKKTWFDSFRLLNINWENFLELYGKVTINSFQISNLMTSDGAGLYIGTSVFDHSCQPNASQVFDGLKMQVRAVKEFDTEIETPMIDYCDQYLPREEKRKILKDHYFFDCNCIRCMNPDKERDNDMIQLKILSDKFFFANDHKNLLTGIKLSELHLKHFPLPSVPLTMTYFNLASVCYTLNDELLTFYEKKLFDNMLITHGTEHSLWKKIFGEVNHSFPSDSSFSQDSQESSQIIPAIY